MATDYQVVVAGGGPVGSFVAESLAHQGVKTLLLERREEETPPICTGIIGVEIESLVPVPEGSVLSTVRSVKLRVAFQRELEYSNHGTLAYVVDRKAFDGFLLQRALSAGAELMKGANLKGLSFKPPNGVELTVQKNGSTFTLTANLLVLATGFSSTMLEKLGLPTYPSTTQGAQIEVPLSSDGSSIEVYFSKTLVPKGFLWVVPLGREMARVGLVTPQDSVNLLKSIMTEGFLKDRVSSFDPQRVRMRLLPRGPISKTYSNGVLVVGEAAGQLKATTYGGIYYGMLCGECAVNTALTALDVKRSTEDVLATYETQWRAKIGRELEEGARWRNLFESMSDEQMVIAADIIGGEGIFNKMKSVVKFDWHRDVIGLGLAYLKKHGLNVMSNSMPGRVQ